VSLVGLRQLLRSVSTVSATRPDDTSPDTTSQRKRAVRSCGGGVQRRASRCPVCRCNRDGMQEGRGSNPLSSTLPGTAFLQLNGGGFQAAIAPLV
jgi:hypothetical protein